MYVDQGHDSRWLVSQNLIAGAVHWIAGEPPAAAFECTAMTRYRQPLQACRVRLEAGRLHVRFALPQRAVTPGQSVVLYGDDECLGGAIIDTTDAPTIGDAP